MADTGEFDGFYRRESEGVLVFFARRTLDPETALDLTAETFGHAYLGWRGLRGESHEERQAWLYTIARRRLTHYLRRGRIERRATPRDRAAHVARSHDHHRHRGSRRRVGHAGHPERARIAYLAMHSDVLPLE
jgi:DNA-directed RNA polymerase specialized sigma24 family protein